MKHRKFHIILVLFIFLFASKSFAQTTYEVSYGDSLWSIAAGVGCSSGELQLANRLLDDDELQFGQILQIPICGESLYSPNEGYYRFHEVDVGEDLENIAEDYGCSISEIALANGIRNELVFAGDELMIPRCNYESGGRQGERVHAGDDLSHFARRHNCAMETIVESNQLNNRFIRAGQRLIVPENCADPFEDELEREVDSTTLTTLLNNTRLPRDFGAYIVEITFDEGRRHIISERRFDYDGTSDSRSWNPASTVKLFPAITSLLKIRALGFQPNANLVFGSSETSVEELVREALGPSNNIAYDYLVVFTGQDRLNNFLRPFNGFDSTAIVRPYELSTWMRTGMPASLRWTPPMFIEDEFQSVTFEEELATGETFCSSSACTTLADLGETLRRIMLQEYLDDESFGLHHADLAMVREILSSTRERGEEVVTRLRPSFSPETIFYHKAGYSNNWYSDNVFIDDPTSNRVWIVTMVGHRGRSSLNRVTLVIADLIVSDAFTSFLPLDN